MNDLKYCPRCGKPHLKYNGRKMECPDCGFLFYNNTAAAVAVIIRHRQEFMLTRRSQNPKIGKLDLAGGFIDFEETAEEAAARELFEEMKIKIDQQQLTYLCSLPNIYEYKGIEYHTLDLFFELEIDKKFDGILEKSEISELVWLTKKTLRLDDLAFESQKRFFKLFLNI